MDNKNNMKMKTSGPRPRNYYDILPENRDFYLLDKEENIKNFKKTNMDDPEYIYVITEDEKKKIHENIYKRKDFISDYDFIKIETKNPEVYFNCLIPKKKFNIAKENRLLTEIMQRPFFLKEIYRITNVNFNGKKDINFKEVFNIPTEKRFYNKIFTLYFYDRNLMKLPNNQNQITINNNVNNRNNIINNNINNNIINNNINNTGNIGQNNFYNNNNISNTDINNRFKNNFNSNPLNNNGNNNLNNIYNNNNFMNNNNNSTFNNNINNNNINNIGINNSGNNNDLNNNFS